MLVALVLGAIGVASFLGFVRSDFGPYPPDSSISVTDDGFTVYVETGTPERRDLRCTANGPHGLTRLDRVRTVNTRSDSRGSFVAVASSPVDLPPGDYAIACEGEFSQFDVPLYIGPRVDLGAVGRVILIGVVAPLFLGFCSVALFILLGVLRYRSRRAATPTVAG